MRERVRSGVAVVAALLLAGWTVLGSGDHAAAAVQAVLIPVVFVVAGVLGPAWAAARFTCRALVLIGTIHLGAFALCVAALQDGSAVTHVLSQICYTAGFAVLIPFVAGYPSGPARPAWWLVAAIPLLLPVAAAFSGPTPAVLQVEGRMRLLGPVAGVLPAGVAPAAAAIFALPVIAVAVAAVRAVRGGRELRGRLALPLAAGLAFALLLLLGSVLPIGADAVTAALVLVTAPLVPVGLVAGSRALRRPMDGEVGTPPSSSSADAPGGPRVGLTEREHDVLAAMADGASNDAIAKRLHVSRSAVEKHTTAIFDKLGLEQDAAKHRRVSAVVAYLRAVREPGDTPGVQALLAPGRSEP